MKTPTLTSDRDLSIQIADAIRQGIIDGDLIFDARLPSETELSETFGVSRPTVREALKRLAAQNLIRTQRGATGGAFVNRLTFEEAYDQQSTTSTLLLSMNDVDFDTACEARFALERACAPLAAKRHAPNLVVNVEVRLRWNQGRVFPMKKAVTIQAVFLPKSGKRQQQQQPNKPFHVLCLFIVKQSAPS